MLEKIPSRLESLEATLATRGYAPKTPHGSDEQRERPDLPNAATRPGDLAFALSRRGWLTLLPDREGDFWQAGRHAELLRQLLGQADVAFDHVEDCVIEGAGVLLTVDAGGRRMNFLKAEGELSDEAHLDLLVFAAQQVAQTTRHPARFFCLRTEGPEAFLVSLPSELFNVLWQADLLLPEDVETFVASAPDALKELSVVEADELRVAHALLRLREGTTRLRERLAQEGHRLSEEDRHRATHLAEAIDTTLYFGASLEELSGLIDNLNRVRLDVERLGWKER
ncbi:MAG: hypothetical protein IT371_22305 [Deltaproteobacteria bacterium]|nr:hypothetical protein [Deltaproteobacteria bacterium]